MDATKQILKSTIKKVKSQEWMQLPVLQVCRMWISPLLTETMQFLAKVSDKVMASESKDSEACKELRQCDCCADSTQG